MATCEELVVKAHNNRDMAMLSQVDTWPIEDINSFISDAFDLDMRIVRSIDTVVQVEMVKVMKLEENRQQMLIELCNCLHAHGWKPPTTHAIDRRDLMEAAGRI